ncbi:MAG: ABC transporter, partial [Bacteroidota bacterium]
MKDLSYLNKYLLKYKFRLIFGALFIVIANFFAIVPAVIVRYAFDILGRSYGIFSSFEGFDLQNDTVSVIGSSVVILAVLILTSALLRGVF